MARFGEIWRDLARFSEIWRKLARFSEIGRVKNVFVSDFAIPTCCKIHLET